ncbi:iron ABC transporter permease [Auritidibacter ignavus]|uniref:Iron ABC transporter permease n=1 Tax=Auritidibacter ignavus TaxID=678932 RepID=A0AAJ6DBC0_9MICC|nr:iron ABC transporter permease [Auritidibacter ignavus]AXR74438.1 iron ABC transporter permease [Auritidibacter sp. NML130574]PXA76781.1 iron ABC transporter permease [Auritidibacter sp. NML120779]PXA79323.1 iron ABC transporter permease [Auritidibacter sp. NML120636]RMX22317.1 iron ABC transporter permease [Auritidibacter ignavus]WGH80956.1 iron ABC transporter permease [Auritidibacter ignavus]
MKAWIAPVLCLFFLLLASAASIAYGSRENDLREVIDVLRGGGDAHLQQVLAARWPRTVVGATVGASLAVSGVIIQGLTRNPLGEPGLLGVTTGASAAVVTAVAFFGFSATVGPATVLVALPGAIVVVVLVYVLSRSSGSQSVVPLILAGAVVSAVLTAYIQAMVLTRPQVFDSYRHWVVGSLAGAQFETLWAVLPAVILGLLLAVILAPGLNTLALGDEVAVSLGAPVVAIRAGGILAATLLAAAATAAVGPIAFIGLAAPHLVRSLVGGDFRQQVPVAILLGASLLLASDVVARVITRPEELMVGVVTAFLGAPFLLVAVRRGKVAV